jgi:hypothetical protein
MIKDLRSLKHYFLPDIMIFRLGHEERTFIISIFKYDYEHKYEWEYERILQNESQ